MRQNDNKFRFIKPITLSPIDQPEPAGNDEVTPAVAGAVRSTTGVAPTVIRLASGLASGPAQGLNAILPGAGVVGAGVVGGAGEVLAQLIESGWDPRKLNLKRIGLETALSAIPMGRTVSAGREAAKGATLAASGVVGRRMTDEENPQSFTEAANPLNWSGGELAGAALGSAIGYGLGRRFQNRQGPAAQQYGPNTVHGPSRFDAEEFLKGNNWDARQILQESNRWQALGNIDDARVLRQTAVRLGGPRTSATLSARVAREVEKEQAKKLAEQQNTANLREVNRRRTAAGLTEEQISVSDTATGKTPDGRRRSATIRYVKPKDEEEDIDDVLDVVTPGPPASKLSAPPAPPPKARQPRQTAAQRPPVAPSPKVDQQIKNIAKSQKVKVAGDEDDLISRVVDRGIIIDPPNPNVAGSTADEVKDLVTKGGVRPTQPRTTAQNGAPKAPKAVTPDVTPLPAKPAATAPAQPPQGRRSRFGPRGAKPVIGQTPKINIPPTSVLAQGAGEAVPTVPKAPTSSQGRLDILREQMNMLPPDDPMRAKIQYAIDAIERNRAAKAARDAGGQPPPEVPPAAAPMVPTKPKTPPVAPTALGAKPGPPRLNMGAKGLKTAPAAPKAPEAPKVSDDAPVMQPKQELGKIKDDLERIAFWRGQTTKLTHLSPQQKQVEIARLDAEAARLTARKAEIEQQLKAPAPAAAPASNPVKDMKEKLDNARTKAEHPRKKGRSGSDTGAIDPALAVKLGSTLAGAAVGGATNEEDPLKGALLGGAAGLAAGAGASKLGKFVQAAPMTGVKVPGIERAANAYRAALLSNPYNLNVNALLAPYGAGLVGSLERGITGILDKDANLMLQGIGGAKQLVNPAHFDRLSQAWKTSGKVLHGAGELERGEKLVGEGATWLDKILAIPSSYMYMGDLATRNALMEAGIPEEIARQITLTSNPKTGVGRWIAESGKRVPESTFLLPFKRTAVNIVESGLERAPGVGILWNAIRNPEHKQQLAQVAAQQGLGVAAYAIGKYVGENTEADRTGQTMILTAMSNAGGQYGSILAAGFAHGLANQTGKTTAQGIAAGAQSFIQDLPLPSTQGVMSLVGQLRSLADEGVADPRAVRWPQQHIPNMLLPGFLKDSFLDQFLTQVENNTGNGRQFQFRPITLPEVN